MARPNQRPDYVPTGTERAALRAALRAMGYSVADSNRLIVAGMTLAEMADAVIAEQAAQP